MKMKLRMEPEQVIEQAVRAVKRARRYTDNVEFSPEDAGRSETDFLCRVLEAVIAAGATTVNIPDTVGYNLPHQFGELIRTLIERVPNSDKAVFSVHCHNDLGLAVGNLTADNAAFSIGQNCIDAGGGPSRGGSYHIRINKTLLVVIPLEFIIGVGWKAKPVNSMIIE